MKKIQVPQGAYFAPEISDTLGMFNSLHPDKKVYMGRPETSWQLNRIRMALDVLFCKADALYWD